MTIQEILGGSLGEVIKDVIGAFKLDPTVKAQIEAQVAENSALLEAKEMDLNAKLNEVAGENIRTEEESDDKFTKRARPAVIWVGLGMMVWNWCFVPLAGLHWHVPSLPIPDMFLEIWGVAVTGYTFARTVDKALSLPGESSIKLPFGASLSNKN